MGFSLVWLRFVAPPVGSALLLLLAWGVPVFPLAWGGSPPAAAALTAPGVVSVAGGYGHGLAVLGDGTVAAWGYNRFGQGGTDVSDSCRNGNDDCLLTPRPVAGLPAILAVAGGGNHSLALATNGMVWAWGANYSGQLGAPVGAPCTSLTGICTPVPTQVSGLAGVVAIAAGHEHSLALKADGTVWAWGANTDGALGTTSADQCGRVSAPYACAKSPVRVAGLTGVVAIAAGAGYHSLALQSDGTVWAWGRNREGQLGVAPGPVCNLVACERTPVRVPGLTGVAAIGVGEYFSLAALADGTVWAWGDNVYGTLGDGTFATSGCGCRPAPAPVAGLTGATAVAGGSYYGAARTADGGIWVWGLNAEGEFGDGGVAPDSPTPRRVAGLGAATALAGGSQSIYAILADGTLWDWGSEYNAELGRGTFGNAPRPIGPVAFPGLALAPARVAFGDQAVGTTGAARAVTLTNTTAAAVTITAITASGDFAQANGCPATLAAGASCTIAVTFTPTAAGPTVGGLRVASDDLAGPLVGDLGGTGVAGPQLALGASSLAFGSRPLNVASAPQTTTLRNTGTQAATLTGITVSGDFAQTNDCPQVLASGANCAIGVTFTPTVAGARTGQLRVTSDATGSPNAVALSGTGLESPQLVIDRAGLTFYPQRINTASLTPETLEILVSNPTLVSVAIASISSAGPHGTDFTQTTTCGTTLAPGAQCRVSVSFRPAYQVDASSALIPLRSASLVIASNAQSSPHSVALLGRAYQPTILYVHGFTDPFRPHWFPDLIDPLVTQFGPKSLVLFQYYQDAGNNDGGHCNPGEHRFLEPAVNSGLPLDTRVGLSVPRLVTANPPRVDLQDPQPYCDSQGDLGWNSLLMHQEIQRLYANNGNQSVVIVANSMGGAITRGFLAYSADQNDGVAATMVDSVVFLQAAQDGSWLAYPAKYSWGEAISQQMGFPINHERPAAQRLQPQSVWYQWVNDATAQRLPNLPYYNVYGDIRVVKQQCTLLYCRDAATLPIGDGLMQAGTNNPFDTPFQGGARFLRGNAGATNWQWSLPHTIYAQPDFNVLLTPQPTAFTPLDLALVGLEVYNARELHLNVGKPGTFNQIPALDCQTHALTTIDLALRRVLEKRLGGTSYNCQP